MILYSVNYKGDLSNYEWSIVTIHKSLEGAEKAKSEYERNWTNNRPEADCEYRIIEIDTDSESDCIYDYNTIE